MNRMPKDVSDAVAPTALVPVPGTTISPGFDDVPVRSRIFTVRGVQVMFDRDLAELYGVPTKRLNEQVKRNAERFPPSFMFQLTADEFRDLRSQIATSNGRDGDAAASSRSQNATSNRGGTRYRPYAFTEHGIIMLASALNSPVAIEASVRITNAFVAMRRALASIAPVMARLAETERRQLEDRSKQIADQTRNEERFDRIFKAMDGGDFPPQKVFFEGKHYDAWSFARKLVRKAAKSIVLVDNYCDDATLDLLSCKRGGASVTIATTQKSATTFLTPAAVAKFNKQNPPLAVKTTGIFHDRFLILDGAELYHFGASLKDLGRHYCAVSRMDPMFIPSIMARI